MKRQHPNDPNLFWCSKCKEYKPIDDFNKSKKYIVNGYCKECLRRPTIKKNCIICGNDFIAKKGNEKYCSDLCKGRGKNKVIRDYYLKKINPQRIEERSCFWCGKKYTVTLGHHGKKGMLKGEHAKYCSDGCKIKYSRRPKHERICEICGNGFMSQSNRAKTCSLECFRRKIFGDKIILTCPECGEERSVYEKQRNIAAAGDGYMCEKCRHNVYSKIARHSGIHIDRTQKERNKRRIENITDGYAAIRLRKHGIPLTNQNLEMERARVIMCRTLKDFKKWRAENEPNRGNVHGKQQENETNYEGRLST